MALGDIYFVTLFQSYGGVKPCNNTFTYLQSTAAGNSDDVCLALAEELGVLVLLQSTTMLYEKVEAINLMNPSDFGTFTFLPGAAGDRIGDTLPPNCVFRFRLNRQVRDIRAGQKRFSGILEADATNGVLAAAIQTPLANMAAMLASQISSTFVPTANYVPVVVKRDKVTDPVTGKVTYPLPVSPGTAQWYQVQSVTPSQNVGTQASRVLPPN